MAIEPPQAPVSQLVPQPATAPASPKKSGCFGRGCGFGCGGCLLVAVLIALLAAGGGWWFFVVQASAAVSAPAALVVINQPITVDGHPGTPGQPLNAGASVATGESGHGAIDFPDGSYMRLSPNTTVQVTSVQLQKNGNLQAVALAQKVGRTFMNVQHLANGASFSVAGHAVTAEVRGTQFEVVVNPGGTNVIKVFAGTVKVSGGGRSVNVSAGQQITVAADGTLGPVVPIARDPQDPYPLAAQCANQVSTGTTAGTAQTSTGDGLATGQTAEVDYNSPGGTVSVALCYPGSFMTLSLIDPSGTEHASRNGASPVTGHVSGPPGLWRAIVHAIDVPGGESYAVAFATDAPCFADNVDTGGAVRQTLSNSQIASALADSGTTGVTLVVSGASPASARIVYASTVGGLPVTWTIDFYAATPALGAVITEVTVRGVNVTTQVISNLSSIGGNSISSIPSGFSVDRVYSCAAANGDNLMVVEGHR
ncbi:MAG TPA: FecR family protein [Candidatus Limnocylindrales bacterium]|nr:FecR family protein [Candidatus Limnocylindrales bacterium]